MSEYEQTETTEPGPTAKSARETNGAILRRWLRNIGPWVLVAIGMWWLGSSLDSTVSGPAPGLQVEIDGTPFDLAAANRIVVLNFWAAWCPPCRAEAPVLAQAHEKLGTRGMVLGLAVDTISISRAGRLGMDYPHALVSQDVLERFGVQMLPTTVVVDHEGNIVESFVGEVTTAALDEALDEALERALDAQPTQLSQR